MVVVILIDFCLMLGKEGAEVAGLAVSLGIMGPGWLELVMFALIATNVVLPTVPGSIMLTADIPAAVAMAATPTATAT